jgi:hypothetical protein
VHSTLANRERILETIAMQSDRSKSNLVRLLIFAVLLAAPTLVSASPIEKQALVGRWDYTSYTMLEKGKPSGTVQFKPGSMVFTYHEDGTWEMEANDATHTRLNGTYKLVNGSELILTKADGSRYQDFEIEITSDDKAMVLKDKRSVLTANKLESAP